jgi:hypothetical protein
VVVVMLCVVAMGTALAAAELPSCELLTRTRPLPSRQMAGGSRATTLQGSFLDTTTISNVRSVAFRGSIPNRTRHHSYPLSSALSV